MDELIKKYEINADESDVFAISVVDMPAVESDFVYLSKQEKQYVALDSNEKHMIYGCALRPDFPIYRNDANGEYYIQFSKEAVEKLCRKFFKNGFQSNWTKGHMEDAEGMTVVESWLKSDMNADKSIALGLDKELPIGTWFVGAYCDSNELWEEVKNGNYKGFSVEAWCALDELNFSKNKINDNMNIEANESFFERLKKILCDALHPVDDKESVNLEETVTETITVEAPTEEQTIAEPVVEEQIVVEQQPVNEQPTEQVVEEPVIEEQIVEEPVSNPLEDIVKNLNSEIEALKEQINGLKADNDRLSREPSVKPANVNGGNSSTFSEWRDRMRSMI